jgi:hypothetical protein
MQYKAVTIGSVAFAALIGLSAGAMASNGHVGSITPIAGHAASTDSHVSSAQNSPAEQGHDRSAFRVAGNWRLSTK